MWRLQKWFNFARFVPLLTADAHSQAKSPLGLLFAWEMTEIFFHFFLDLVAQGEQTIPWSLFCCSQQLDHSLSWKSLFLFLCVCLFSSFSFPPSAVEPLDTHKELSTGCWLFFCIAWYKNRPRWLDLKLTSIRIVRLLGQKLSKFFVVLEDLRM